MSKASQAIAVMFPRHYRSLVHMATMLVRDIAIAEDVVQESFVDLYKAWPRLRDTDEALIFLKKRVVRRSRWALTATASASSLSSDMASVGVSSDMPSVGVSSDMPSAEDSAIELLEQSAIVAGLKRLPDAEREALVLRYYGDLSNAEIAVVMGISKDAVRGHTRRALVDLRRELTRDGDTEESAIDRVLRSHMVADSSSPSTAGREVVRERTGHEKPSHQRGDGESGLGQGGQGPEEPGLSVAMRKSPCVARSRSPVVAS